MTLLTSSEQHFYGKPDIHVFKQDRVYPFANCGHHTLIGIRTPSRPVMIQLGLNKTILAVDPFAKNTIHKKFKRSSLSVKTFFLREMKRKRT